MQDYDLRYLEQKIKKDCIVQCGQLFYSPVFLGIVCAVAGVIFSPWLLDIMSVPEEVRAGSLIYCRFILAEYGQ